MNCEVDVFVGNYAIIDPDVYQLWVDGYTSHEAAKILQQRGILQQWGISIELLLSDVLDHYRTFQMLERLLYSPAKLREEWSFQMDQETQLMLIEKYYGLDDAVVREVMSKKLSSRNRKDLDEVSEKTGINLKSCRRQFDNIKRIHKMVEEMPGAIITNILTTFLLPLELARKYATVVFISYNRFETSKRKLQYLTFSDFFHCAHMLMENWSQVSHHASLQVETDSDIDNSLDVDREFLTDLRDIRVLQDKEREHKAVVCSQLKGKLTDKVYSDVEASFKIHSRSFVALAGHLNRSRELRSFFQDLVERLIEPFKQARWTARDLRLFLDSYTQAGTQLLQSDAHVQSVWERYMKVVVGCLMKLYHN